MNLENIGQIIKERRKMLAITQKELAELAKIGINTLTKIERGEANPSFDVLHRVLSTLGLEIDVHVKYTIDIKKYHEKSSHILTRDVRRRGNRTVKR